MSKKFKSLKNRLFFTVFIVVVVIILFFIVVNKVLLETFHYKARVNELLNTSIEIEEKIDSLDTNNM